MDSTKQPLSDRDQGRVLALISELMAIQSVEDFVAVMSGPFREVLPHEMLICGMGRITDKGLVTDYRLLPIDFPMDYIGEISAADGGFISPVMSRWIDTREPQLFSLTQAESVASHEWLRTFRKYGLDNVAAHGMHDLESDVTSYFSFSRIPEELGERHRYLLRLLVPHLHAALAPRISQLPYAAEPDTVIRFMISDREREVIQWMLVGKTNWEIGRLLGISEITARNHISKIFRKLNVTKRAQAVAKLSSLRGKLGIEM
jgi:LuxR family transcriptional regulator, quorum-sensing system regulator CviR